MTNDWGEATTGAFPTVRWKTESATFSAAPVGVVSPETDAGGAALAPLPAALVFPFYGDRVVLADIENRGWCIPSGHIEPGETAEQAVRREAWEEAGVTLSRVAYIGYFVLTQIGADEVRHAPTFIAEVANFAEVPEGSESRGMQMANVEDVAGLYFSWDALLASVFAQAYREKLRRFPAGVSLSSLMSTGDDDNNLR